MWLATKSILAATPLGGTMWLANTWGHVSRHCRSSLSAIAAAAARSPTLSEANRRQTFASFAAVLGSRIMAVSARGGRRHARSARPRA